MAIGGVALVLSVGLLAAPAAYGATKEPGFLQPSDLPGSVDLAGEPRVETIVNQFAIDADACTQTFEADEAALNFIGIQFTVPGPEQPPVTALSQVVISYPDTNAARAAFKHRTATARAGVACGSVDNVVTAGVPPSSIVYDEVKFPKIANGSYAVARSPGDPAEAAVAVEFVSGPYVVILNTAGNGEGPTVKQLKAIARTAEKRLRGKG